MIINIQAFNATGKDNRGIYDELDDFQSRRPIDVISANRPIVIIDEPQKIGAPKSLEALSRFNAFGRWVTYPSLATPASSPRHASSRVAPRCLRSATTQRRRCDTGPVASAS